MYNNHVIPGVTCTGCNCVGRMPYTRHLASFSLRRESGKRMLTSGVYAHKAASTTYILSLSLALSLSLSPPLSLTLSLPLSPSLCSLQPASPSVPLSL